MVEAALGISSCCTQGCCCPRSPQGRRSSQLRPEDDLCRAWEVKTAKPTESERKREQSHLNTVDICAKEEFQAIHREPFCLELKFENRDEKK